MFSFTEPTLAPVFTVFGLPVYPYALFMALGAVLALVMALFRAKKTGVKGDNVLLYAMIAIPLAVICGRIVFCLCRWVDVLDFGFGYILRIDKGGFSVMGGVAGLALAAVIVRAIRKVSFLDMADTVVPGLLMLLAIARFAEGSTINGTGPDVMSEALQFMPLARKGLYGEYTYAVHMAEGLTALVAGVYTQAMEKKPRGLAAGTGAIIACAAQIVWESARRDEVLVISFVKYVMVFSALILLAILLISLHRLDWPFAGKALMVGGLFLCAGVVGLNEFFIDGKLIQSIPIWLCYLTDAIAAGCMGLICLRCLRAACDNV
ncbi:MAG: prolipoprotein diacylglyceryl transferase [Clostridia bacterium]|nr:prolipoprotein diacylglyceryl transferase [Clostridia bacterium]